MSAETVRFTREQFCDLVWSKPMTTIAAEFGMSSVAFAKYCKAADVPRPEREYWRRLGAGQKPKRPRLPKPTPKTQLEVIIEKYPRPSLSKHRAPADVARISVPERIAKLHPVVKELDSLLKPDAKHQYMPTVRGFADAVLKVGEESRRRALRLLHTILTAIEANGHQVRLRSNAHAQQWDRSRRALEVVLDGEVITLSLREHLNRSPHVKTKEEERYTWMATKYDFEASGKLHLELKIRWPIDTQTAWRDREKKPLENYLGEIVWTVDEAARALVKYRLEIAERAREAEARRQEERAREAERQHLAAEERKRLAEAKARAGYQLGLQRDLRRMARSWSAASQIRSFLEALEDTVPVSDRGEGFRKWLAWAVEYAEQLDPLNTPQKLAKELEPNLSDLRPIR